MGTLLYLLLILLVGALLWWVFRSLGSSQGVTKGMESLPGEPTYDWDRAEADDRARQDLMASQSRGFQPVDEVSSDTADSPDLEEAEQRWRQSPDPSLGRDAAVATSAPEVFAGDEILAEAYLGAEAEAEGDAGGTAPHPSAESVARPNDQVVLARLGSPQLLLDRARVVLDGLAEETGVDFDDPYIRPLEGGGAAMSLPVGAGAESALFVLDLLRDSSEHGALDAEAWLTIRAEDQFLFVSDDRASAELNAAAAEVDPYFSMDDPGYTEAIDEVVNARLSPLGLPVGTRLYAYTWAGGVDAAPRLMATAEGGESYEIRWDDLADSRLRLQPRTYRPYVDIPADVQEVLGVEGRRGNS